MNFGSVFHYLTSKYEDHMPYADPRTKHWLLLNNSPKYVLMVTGVYLAFGLRYIKTRSAFKIPVSVIFLYNAGLVALSLYMFIEIYANVFALNYNFWCAPYNAETIKNLAELRLAKVLWWCFFSKAIELLDTVLMILRKKNEQVTFLHVFHHASMLILWWWLMLFFPGGTAFFGSSTNALVHVVMYSYYGLAAIPSMKKYLWWKPWITRIQLIQFVVTLSYSVQVLFSDCDFPLGGPLVLAGYSVLMFVLFTHFYVLAYRRKKSGTKQLGDVNGDVTQSLKTNKHQNSVYQNNGTQKKSV